MGFYSSLAAVNRTSDPGRRSYAATGYLLPNASRSNLKVLTEAMVTKVLLDRNVATGVEFSQHGQSHSVRVAKEVILSAGVIQSPQLLELSGIGNPDVLQATGIDVKVENNAVGEHFQDHVLGGMLYDLADGVNSMDALHGVEYAKAQEEIYRQTNKGPYGSPGMLMGFVSYASLVDQETLDSTIDEVRQHSLANTGFEKAQEEVIVRQLSDPTFANIQTFCKLSCCACRKVSILNLARRYPMPAGRQRWRIANRLLQSTTRGQKPRQPSRLSGAPIVPWKRSHHFRQPFSGTKNRHRLPQTSSRRQDPRPRDQVDGSSSITSCAGEKPRPAHPALERREYRH